MDWQDQFITWLETLSRWQGESTYKITRDDEERFTVRIFTASNDYQITSSPTYLGCQVSSRMTRPGETWTRGNDLPDGSFSVETWYNILAAIVGYELKAIEPEHNYEENSILAEVE